MNDLVARIKVVAKSVLAWLTVIAAVLAAVAQELKDVDGIPAPVVQWLVTAAGVLTIVVFQVRAHTPVDVSQQGLLPPKGPGTPTLDADGQVHDPDAGLALIELLVGGLILLVIAYLLFR
jgi:hypothetical protein